MQHLRKHRVSTTTYPKLGENRAEITEILLIEDRNVESRFEKKSSPIENTRKIWKNDMPPLMAKIEHDALLKMKNKCYVPESAYSQLQHTEIWGEIEQKQAHHHPKTKKNMTSLIKKIIVTLNVYMMTSQTALRSGEAWNHIYISCPFRIWNENWGSPSILRSCGRFKYFHFWPLLHNPRARTFWGFTCAYRNWMVLFIENDLELLRNISLTKIDWKNGIFSYHKAYARKNARVIECARLFRKCLKYAETYANNFLGDLEHF